MEVPHPKAHLHSLSHEDQSQPLDVSRSQLELQSQAPAATSFRIDLPAQVEGPSEESHEVKPFHPVTRIFPSRHVGGKPRKGLLGLQLRPNMLQPSAARLGKRTSVLSRVLRGRKP